MLNWRQSLGLLRRFELNNNRLVNSVKHCVRFESSVSSAPETSTAPNKDERKYIITNSLMENQVVELRLNDPKKRNALSFGMLNELKSILQEYGNHKGTRALVISAEPPVFSAGHDLRELKSETGLAHHAKIFSVCTEVMKLIQDIEIPVIAQVKGVAAAAGCQLIASCDIVVASENAKFSVPGAKAGLFCHTPGVALARAVPRKVALDMLLTGDTISAQEALRAGLVSRVVSDSQLEEKTMEVCASICQLSRSVIGAGKAFFYIQVESDRNTAYRTCERVMLENLRMTDCQEGILGFLEKRKPTWTHTLTRAH